MDPYQYKPGPTRSWPARAAATAQVMERFLPGDGMVLEVHDIGCGPVPMLPAAIAAHLDTPESRLHDVFCRGLRYIGYDHPSAIQPDLLVGVPNRQIEVNPMIYPMPLTEENPARIIRAVSRVPYVRRVAVLTGVLEYLPDPRMAVRTAASGAGWLVVSYASGEDPADAAFGRASFFQPPAVESMLWSFFGYVRAVRPDEDNIRDSSDTRTRFWVCTGGIQ